MELIFESNFKKLKDLYNQNLFNDFESFFFKCKSKNLLNAKSFNLFGLYLVKRKKYKEAIEIFHLAIQTNKEFIEPKINLAGVYFYNFFDSAKSKEILLDLLFKNKNNKKANLLLADIYLYQKDYLNAEKIYKTLLEDYPTDSEIYNKLGMYYFNTNSYEKAIDHFKKAIQLDPKNFDYFYNLYSVYKIQNNYKEAEYCLIDMSKRFSSNLSIFFELVNLYRGLGEFKKSDKILEQIVFNSNNENPEAIFELLSSPKYTEQDDLHSKVLKKWSTYENNQKEKIGYGLFKYFDRKKKFDNASYYLKESLKLTENRIKYKFSIEKEQFEFLKNTFDSDFFKKNLDMKQSNLSFKNLFIVGLHRSGSTLLEQMLSTNPSLISYSEITYFPDLITKFYPNQDLNFFKKEILNTNENTFKLIGEEYLKKINFKEKQISIDKQLSNFRMIGFILVSLPNALIIHIKRNKNDNLFSILSNYYSEDHAPWSYNIEDLKKYYDSYVDLMRHWGSVVTDRIVTIDYENLVYDPELELAKILDKLNLKWNGSYLNFRKNKNLVPTQSVYQVRDSIYDNSIGKWKNYSDFFSELFKNW